MFHLILLFFFNLETSAAIISLWTPFICPQTLFTTERSNRGLYGDSAVKTDWLVIKLTCQIGMSSTA